MNLYPTPSHRFGGFVGAFLGRLGLLCLIAATAVPTARAGWTPNAGGTYSYLDTANWGGGVIDDTFPAALTLLGAQTATFNAGRATPGGMSFLYDGAFDLVLRSDGTGVRTLTLGGDINVAPADGGRTVTIGSTTASQNLHVNLGGGTRTLSVNPGNTLTLHNTVTNGSLTLTGGGAVVFSHLTGTVTRVSINGGAAAAILNSQIQSSNSVAFGNSDASLTVSNSYFGLVGTLTTGTGNNDIAIQVLGSGVADRPTFVDCGSVGATIGFTDGSGNTLLVDGQGVTGGAVITGIANSGNVGFAVGRGANSSSNEVVIANGGEIWDYETDSNRNNGIGVGSGANGNRIEILGGDGFVSKLYKGYPHTVGSGSATGNVVVVDGKGYPGSAVWQAGSGTAMTVGNGAGAFDNALLIKDGGAYLYSTVSLGTSSSSNRIEVVGTGSELTGAGGSTYLRIGAGTYSAGNVLYVADGGVVKSFTKWSNCIGGAEQSAAGTSIGNRMVIGSNGTVTLNGSDLAIGRTKDAGSAAIGNQVLVSGPGATWNFSGRALSIGAAANGSLADGNELRVEHGGYAVGASIRLGSTSDTVAGTAGTDNRLVVTDGGWANVTDTAYCGAANGSPASSGNRVLATSGGILQANKLVVAATNDNTIVATDGGVFQFTTITPTVTSLTPGDIAIDGGVISFVGLTTANVRGNLGGTQLTNMTWSGSNAFRLNNASTTTTASNHYVFDPGFGPTNYARLEMVDGTTSYRGQAGNVLTIGQSVGSSGSMLCSNTTASVALPFVLNGDLTVFNSTLTLQQTAEISGDVFIDLDHLPEAGAALIVEGALTLGASSTLNLSGTAQDGLLVMACNGTRTGTFSAYTLPRDYTVKYGASGAITLQYMPATTVLIVR